MTFAKRFRDFMATGSKPTDAIAEDESLADHDKRFHPGGYDPKTQTCEFRERRAKLDPVDAEIKKGGISGLFTGSAASYSRPSLIHVGTGEGSQVYGWGLYASSERGVAESYAFADDRINAVLNGNVVDTRDPNPEDPKIYAAYWVALKDGDVKEAINTLKGQLSRLSDGHPFRKQLQKAIKELKDRKNDFSVIKTRGGRNLYEQTFFTNREPGDESHLLKWYEPVSEENLKRIVKAINADSSLNNEYSKTLLKKAKTAFLSNLSNRIGNKGIEEATGADVYKAITELYNTNREQNASEFLARADIDGIKYPVDSYGGKTVKDGDTAGWNYVSFRDDNIRIDRKFVDGKEVEVRDARDAAIEKYLSLAADAAPVGKHADGSPCYTQGCRRRRIPWKNIEKHNARERAQMKFDFDGKSAEQKKVDEEMLKKHDEEFHPGGYREGDWCLYRKVLNANGNDERLKTAEWGEKMVGRVRMASSENLRATIKKLDATRNEWLIGVIKKELEYRRREEEHYMEYLGEMA